MAPKWDALRGDEDEDELVQPPPLMARRPEARRWVWIAGVAATTAAAVLVLVVFTRGTSGTAPVDPKSATALFNGPATAAPALGSAVPPPAPLLWSTLPTPPPLIAPMLETPGPAAREPETSATVAPSTAAPAPATKAHQGPRSGFLPREKRRRGSFLVLGDWGFDGGLHGNVNDTSCQRSIADAMLEKFEELGDVQFIINVGDSFYPEGLKGKDDPQWDTKWRNVYDKKLRSVPWYSVYGNHDYHHDPCACATDPNECAQVNYDMDDLSRFYMPGYNWYREHKDLDLEVVAMDLNKFMEGWNMSAKADELKFNDCQWTQCPGKCFGNADARADQAFDLFRERFERSPARNLLVFSHYPTDYLSSVPTFLNNLSNNSKHDIIFFGGHRHNVDNTTTWQTPPNRNWVVGGGGGWSCDGPSQGFLVGTVGEDYWVDTYPVLVDYDLCCPPPPTPAPTTTEEPAATSTEEATAAMKF